MRAMRRFAASVIFGHGLTGSRAQGTAARGTAARGLAARSTAILRAAALGLITLIAGSSAVLALVAAGTRPAQATAASAPRSTLASVIPSTAVPRSQVTFAVYCASARATSATLIGRSIGLTQRIKMRPNPAGGDFTVSVILPSSIQAGTYHPAIECSDGTSTTARLLVPALGAAGGTSNGGGVWLAAGALIILGAMAGGIALRRKRAHSDDSGSAAGPPDGRAGPPDRWPDQADHDSDQSSLRF